MVDVKQQKRAHYEKFNDRGVPKAGITSTLCSPDEWAPLPKGYRYASKGVKTSWVPSRSF